MERFKVEKDFMVDEYRCVIIGHYMGHRCGYVGIPKGHSLYRVYYNNVDPDIEVHGGFTYSDNGEGEYPVKSDLWWLGFDCGHFNDGKDWELIKSFAGDEENDKIIAHRIEMEKMFPDYGDVRTKEYVENELRNVVKQLKERY